MVANRCSSNLCSSNLCSSNRCGSSTQQGSGRIADERGFTISELLLVSVFVVGLALVALTSVRAISRDTATSDCQTELRTLKLAVAEYQANTGAFPADRGVLVEARLLDADSSPGWTIERIEADQAPTYRAVGSNGC